jgi:hypothetical protein
LQSSSKMKGLSGRLSRFGPQTSISKENLVPSRKGDAGVASCIVFQKNMNTCCFWKHIIILLWWSLQSGNHLLHGIAGLPLKATPTQVGEHEPALEQGAEPRMALGNPGLQSEAVGTRLQAGGGVGEDSELGSARSGSCCTESSSDLVGCPVCGDPLASKHIF